MTTRVKCLFCVTLLPDDGAVFLVEPHLGTRLDVESLKEGVDVAQSLVYTIFTQ